jgi:disulfide bond formation protein DsbB
MPLQRLFAVFILIVALTSLSVSLIAEHLFDKEPCILCLYQRGPFLITGLLAITALCLKLSSKLIPTTFMLCALIYLLGTGIAIYHVGVEQHWWSSGCSGNLKQNATLEQLRASLMQKEVKSCDDADWVLFGISMATYNIFFSSALGLASTVVSMQLWKTLKGKARQ